jgi:hypothetical protein
VDCALEGVLPVGVSHRPPRGVGMG